MGSFHNNQRKPNGEAFILLKAAGKMKRLTATLEDKILEFTFSEIWQWNEIMRRRYKSRYRDIVQIYAVYSFRLVH